MPAKDRSHYRNGWNLRAKVIVAAAYADSSTRCRRCGLTLEQFRAAHPEMGRRSWGWQAGHTVDGDSSQPAAAEHGHCNGSAGAVKRNRATSLNNSERWY